MEDNQVDPLGGLLHGVLGVVLESVGVDVRVRLFLPIGGVTELVLPVLGGARLPAGAQVVALFLSDRPESGVVLGAVEGALSWRRLAAPALAEVVLPALQRTVESATDAEGAVTRTPGLFPLSPDSAQVQFDGGVLLADGRVLFVPATCGPAVRPRIWDPVSGGVRAVEWTGATGHWYTGGVLLHDGRALMIPNGVNGSGSTAQIYDPALDTVTAAGRGVGSVAAAGVRGAVLLADGRVLLVPGAGGATRPLLYDPATDVVSASAVVSGGGYFGAVLLGDGRALLVGNAAGVMLVYDPANDSAAVVTGSGDPCRGGVLLADGRVLLVAGGGVSTNIFDPATNSVEVRASTGGNFRGGLLLADGQVLLAPVSSNLADCRLYNVQTDVYSTPAAVAAWSGANLYYGAVGLADGRVVFCPGKARDLLVWDTGCGVGLGRDVALSGWWNHW